MTETGQPERRNHKRISCNQEVEVQGQGIFRCTQISLGGMYLKSTETYSIGALLDLQFKLTNADLPIKIQGCVIYNHMHMGFGLGFLNLLSEDRKKIEKFIEQASNLRQ